MTGPHKDSSASPARDRETITIGLKMCSLSCPWDMPKDMLCNLEAFRFANTMFHFGPFWGFGGPSECQGVKHKLNNSMYRNDLQNV